MIQMQRHRDRRAPRRLLGRGHEELEIIMTEMELDEIQDNRRAAVFRRPDDRLEKIEA